MNTPYRDISQAMSLLTTTTGFVDVYIINAYEQLSWLIPQNLVLAALSAEAGLKSIEWREQQLPVLSLHDPKNNNPIALVIEALGGYQRFVLLIDKMPDTRRVRISSLHDIDMEAVNETFSFQIVKMEEQLYQVPDFEKIGKYIASKKPQSQPA